MKTQIDESLQKAARYAGVAYLLTFIVVVYANFGIYDQLYVSGNTAETAKKILENEHFFRLGIVADLFYGLGFVLLLTSLYYILKNVNQRVALIATVWSLVYIIAFVTVTLKTFDALRLLHAPSYLDPYQLPQLQALSKLFLQLRWDRYYGVLLFYCLGSTLFYYLWYKSKYVPKILAIWGMVAFSWCALCAIAFMIYPGFHKIVDLSLFDIPMALCDMVLSLWLIFKGLRIKASSE